MSSAPRFCGSCGAGLTPGAAFCGGCGSRVAAPPQPVPAPVAAAPVYQQPAAMPPPPAYQPPVQQPQYQPAPIAPPPGYGYADWNSLEVQPGEVELGSWVVALGRYTGSLTVTDRRVLFKPKVAGTSVLGMLISQMPTAKARNTVVLSKDQIVDVRSEKGMINTSIVVTTTNGAIISFTRGLMSADPIVAAIQQR